MGNRESVPKHDTGPLEPRTPKGHVAAAQAYFDSDSPMGHLSQQRRRIDVMHDVRSAVCRRAWQRGYAKSLDHRIRVVGS
jgi:hypothetical protein